jgi:GR25 family glycosyltransferase involved in LPS biosynthesis
MNKLIRKSVRKKSRKCTKECTEKKFNVNMSSYVINCKIHKSRIEKFRKFAKEAKMSFCREVCVNGKAFTDDILCEMVKRGIVSKKSEMTPIEVAISLSHLNVLQRFVNSCDDYAIVFEDDVEVRKNFVNSVNKIMAKLEDTPFDMLFLWNGNWMKTKSKMKKVADVTNNIQIMKENAHFNAGAVCYIITKKYAKYLLEKAFPIRNPIDLFYGYYMFRKSSNLLSLKMSYDKECYLSPLFKGRKWVCGGDEGTGNSTQNYDAKTINKIKCKK